MLNNDEAPPQQQQQQWIFTRDELDACGLLEPENRSSMASFVQVLGKHIHLPQVIIATAIVFGHRFYCRESFRSFDLHKIGVTALFLAGKVEEHPKRLESILKGLSELSAPQESPSQGSASSLWQGVAVTREEVLELELVLLQVLCFDLSVDHPYRHVLKWAYPAKSDASGKSRHGEATDELAQTAWGLANESLKTTLCLRVPPKVVALATLELAAEKLQTKAPMIEAIIEDLDARASVEECKHELALLSK